MNRLLLPLFVLLFVGSAAFAQEPKGVSELKQKLASAKTDTDKIKILSDLSWELQTGYLDQAEQYANQEMAIATKLNEEKYICLASNDLGLIKLRRGNLDEALKLNKTAYEIRKKNKDELGMGSSLNKIGTIYQKLDNNAEALKCFLECLRIYEKNKVKPYIAYSQNNVATIYFNLKQSDKALDYYRRALQTNRELGDWHTVAGNLGNIANLYTERKMYDSALVELNESARLLKQTNDNYELPITYNSIGMVYKYKGDARSALPYNQQALAGVIANKDTSDIILYQINTANTLLILKRADEAKTLLDEAEQLIKLTGHDNYTQRLYAQLLHYFVLKGDADKAESYFDKYNALRDTFEKRNFSKQIAEMETKYETEKKEEENLVLKQDNKIKSLTLWFLIIGLGLLLISFYLIYNRYRLKQKAAMQQALLAQQEIRSKAVLEAEETERQRIAKDLHDGLGQMLSAVKLNLSSLESKLIAIEPAQQQLIQHAISLVDDSVKEVRTISHNMMPNMLIKKGLVNAVREFIDKLSGTSIKIDLEISGLNERLDTSLETILYRTLQEIINNVIKHSGASHVTIQLLRFENEVTLMVEDNGKGFDVTSTMAGEKGIGLKNIISRVQFFKGEANFDSRIGKGTTVTIEIPVTVVGK